MDFVDSATGTAHAGHGATVHGQQEAQVGVANMEGSTGTSGATGPVGAGAGMAGTAPGTAPTAPSTTQTAAPAMPSERKYPPGSSTGF